MGGIILSHPRPKEPSGWIGLSIYYHVNRCENNGCAYCIFVNKLCHIYHGNYVGGKNEVLNLQKICRKYFGNFFAPTVFLKSLASLEREKERLELKFNQLLKIWNANVKQWIKKNTLLLLENNVYYYCFCQNKNKCLICRIPNIFYDFGNDLKDDVLNEKYLKKLSFKINSMPQQTYFPK